MAKTYKKYVKFYIPRIVFDHLHYKLSAVPPVFKYDIDIFYSILNELSHSKYSKAFEKDNYFKPLYSRLLKQRYGDVYKLYMKYLNVHSIIGSSRFYRTGTCTYYIINNNDSILQMLVSNYYNHSYCFPIDSIYKLISIDNKGIGGISNKVNKSDIVEIKIDVKSKVGKYIIRIYNKEQDRIKHGKEHILSMATYFKKNLAIDYLKAIEHTTKKYHDELANANGNNDLVTRAENAYNQRIESICQIKDGKVNRTLRFNRNTTNKRIDTNLTNMASDLRKFIVGYDKLSYLDLSNSQPVLLNILLKKLSTKANKKLIDEMALYEELTITGGWYEYLGGIFEVSRDEAKGKWMEIAYSKNGDKSKKATKKIFAKKFPEITKVIEKSKMKDHADFSVALQRIESNIFIDQICKELVEAGIIPYGMHDGLLVSKSKEKETYDIMATVLKKNLGRIPVITVNDIKRYPDQT